MKKEQQIYVFIGFGVIAFIFLYFNFLLGPVNKNISDKAKKIVEVEQTLENAKREVVAIEELRQRSQMLQLEVTELQKLLPKGKDVPGLLRVVTRDAQRFGIKINTFQPQSIVAQPEYNEMLYNLTVTANFHSLGYFFAEIGQEQRLMAIRNLVLSPIGSLDKGQTINATFILISYMSKGG